MLIGIGVDLCKISRMERIVENQHFLQKVFHPKEIEYACSRFYPAQHYASSFAAREAFAKASGLSLSSVIHQGIWVDRTSNGPVLCLSERVRSLISLEVPLICHLSLSHEAGLSIAFVVLEVSK